MILSTLLPSLLGRALPLSLFGDRHQPALLDSIPESGVAPRPDTPAVLIAPVPGPTFVRVYTARSMTVGGDGRPVVGESSQVGGRCSRPRGPSRRHALVRHATLAGRPLAILFAMLMVASGAEAQPVGSDASSEDEGQAALVAGSFSSSAHGSGTSQEDIVAETIRTFHRALEEGDSATAVGLLADDALILEGGGVESRDEYLAHHLKADMAFAAGVNRSAEVHRIKVVGGVAWAVSSTHSVGSVRERSVDSRGAELAVLALEGGEWRIRAIHWSSRR